LWKTSRRSGEFTHARPLITVGSPKKSQLKPRGISIAFQKHAEVFLAPEEIKAIEGAQSSERIEGGVPC
jgi:hypothetical protein